MQRAQRMQRAKLFSFIASIFAVLVSPKLDAEERVLVADEFSSSQISEHWSWLREEAAGWRLEDGRLSIRTKGQIWGPANSQRNILLLSSAQVDGSRGLAAELSVDAGLAMTHAYEHGGLVFYFDDDHWVTLTQLNHVRHETQEIMLVHEVGGRGQGGTAKAVPYVHEKVELRLEVRGSTFSGYYREPGAKVWQSLGSIEFKHSSPKPRFGIVAGQGDDADLHWVRFDDFRLLALP